MIMSVKDRFFNVFRIWTLGKLFKRLCAGFFLRQLQSPSEASLFLGGRGSHGLAVQPLDFQDIDAADHCSDLFFYGDMI